MLTGRALLAMQPLIREGNSNMEKMFQGRFG